MSTTLAADWPVEEARLRVTEADARTALRAVAGRPVIKARAWLRFGPGRTCEPIARLLDRAIVQAENAGLDPQLLVVADGNAQAAEDIIRVRRKAHGIADWIHSPTCLVTIILRPALAWPRPRERTGPSCLNLPPHRPTCPRNRPASMPSPSARRCLTSSTPTWA